MLFKVYTASSASGFTVSAIAIKPQSTPGNREKVFVIKIFYNLGKKSNFLPPVRPVPEPVHTDSKKWDDNSYQGSKA